MRPVTTLLAAIAAIATTAAIALASTGTGPTAHSAALHYQLVKHDQRFTAAGQQHVTATCPEGTKASGGGATAGGSSFTWIGSYPHLDHRTWEGKVIVANGTNPSVHLTVYVVCLQS